MDIGTGTLAEIRKEAAAWIIEIDLDPEGWDRRRFLAWLKSSPRHMDEFLHQSALWKALEDGEPADLGLGENFATADNVVELIRHGELPGTPAEHTRETHDMRAFARRWWPTGLIAATLVLALLATWLVPFQLGTRVLSTSIGEQRVVRLSDHSIVHLNTDSKIAIRFTPSTREVRLIRGEVLFTVERDANRPFRVRADDVGVEALGTQFNVRRRAGDTIVSVVEGRVAVVDVRRPDARNDATGRSESNTPALEVGKHGASRKKGDIPYEAGRPPPIGALAVIAAGGRVRVSADGSINEEANSNVADDVLAWQKRQLIFNQTPLAEVVAEVARYNATPRLTVEGAELQQKALNGVFAADDPESLISFLERAGLSITRDRDTITIRAQ